MTVGQHLQTFAEAIRHAYEGIRGAQPEDQLKRPIQDFIEGTAQVFGLRAATNTEIQLEENLGRPDVGVAVGGLLCGYIELKAPDVGINPRNFRGANQKQWKRFSELPNIIYTNGNEWRLFRRGEQVGDAIRFRGDVTLAGEGVLSESNAEALAHLLHDFLGWEPIVPANPRGLGQLLAPICRLIRQDVLEALRRPESPIATLAGEWRDHLFPDADDNRYADAYAQTLVYAFLLARLSGGDVLDVRRAADSFRSGHALLARVLELFLDEAAREDIRVGADLLERVIAAIPVEKLIERHPNLWLYFYEHFLAAYDPKLRKDYGVYYTPAEVVQCQVRLISELLSERFGKHHGFADDGVVFLDPGCGSGTYPIAALQFALGRIRDRQGPGAAAARATVAAQNMHAFEILVGPYAVAHLRLTQEIRADEGELPEDGVHVYLHDTMESPFVDPPGQRDLYHLPLREENRRAREVKEHARVLVCFGNPPYDRQIIDPDDKRTHRKGGWVRNGDDDSTRPILEDFLEPARQAGQGIHLKNLYNDYVYFWRWALWKVLEQSETGGIVSFITASSYLRGPGFIGMREVMRRLFDELWIIDLEGDNLGPRKTENVFQIQTPVAIAVGMRNGAGDRKAPAHVHYTKIEGTREEKLRRLAQVESLADLPWEDCFREWHKPLLPEREGAYFDWPLLTDLFPWQHSGVQYKRTWPIAPDRETLEWRWRQLVSLRGHDRPTAFHETRDRKIANRYRNLFSASRTPPISTLGEDTQCPRIVRYSFRSFDRQWVILDSRLGDFIKPVLWRTENPRQLYMTSLLTTVLGRGPAATISALPPDLHHFRGSFGGKDVVPLWRGRDGDEPNVTHGLLDILGEKLEAKVEAEDLFAYAYAILACPAYADRFTEELSIPGPRIPLTKDVNRFREITELGRCLIWLHTFAERLVPQGQRSGAIPSGTARIERGVPATTAGYPEEYEYDPESQSLRVGVGVFTPVAPEIFSFEISGLKVVKSWLEYRMKGGAGRRSSVLDEIRPRRWTAEFNDELLSLLWILEHTIEHYPRIEEGFEALLSGPLFEANELPQPSDEERQAPDLEPQPAQILMSLF